MISDCSLESAIVVAQKIIVLVYGWVLGVYDTDDVVKNINFQLKTVHITQYISMGATNRYTVGACIIASSGEYSLLLVICD